MRENEARQAKWGAVEADFYHPLFGQTRLFFARYKVKSLDRWQEGLNKPGSEGILQKLREMVELEKTELWFFEEIPY